MVEFYVEPNTTTIPLGRQGENLARTIYFELSELISNYGEGTATLVCLRPSDTAPYVCSVTRDGIMLSWSPTDTDTAFAGAGKCELRWVVGDVLAKSIVYNTTISASITGAEEMPDKYQSWYEQLLAQIQAYTIATQRIDVLNARVNSFVALEDGSTTGDAELADIRVGADGTQYNTAGDAVRTQIVDVREDIGDLSELETTVKTDLVSAINKVAESGGGLTSDIKDALLQLAAKVAYIDDDGQDYYDDLYNALYPPIPATAISLSASSISWHTTGQTQQLTATLTPADSTDIVSWSSSNTSVATVSDTGLVTGLALGSATITATTGSVSATCSVVIATATVTSISVVYTQSGTVYDSDSLDFLKSDLVITATWSDSSSSTVASADYTLSGTLTVGTSTITVSYGGKTATFTVTVTSELPTGYTKYDYLALTIPVGSAKAGVGILAPIEMKSEYIYEIDVRLSDTTLTSAENIIGTRPGNTGNKQLGLFGTPSTGKLGYWYNGTDTSNTLNVLNRDGEVNHIIIQPVGVSQTYSSYATLNVNGTDYSTGSTASGQTWSSWLGFFAYGVSSTGVIYNGTNKSAGFEIGTTVIKDANGDIIHKFIPCKNSSDYYGYYDRVGEQFYYDSGHATSYTGGNWR